LAGLTVVGNVALDNATNAGRDVQWQHANDRLAFFDNTKATFGNGADLQIYHDGTNSFIQDTAGASFSITATESIAIKTNDTEFAIACNKNGGVELYHNNSKKFETTAIGVTISGDLKLPDGEELRLGNSNDIQFYHDGTHSYLENNTGNLRIRNNGTLKTAQFEVDQVDFNDSANTQVRVRINSDGLRLPQDNDKIQLGAGNDLQIYHNGSSSVVDGGAVPLYIAGDPVKITDSPINKDMAIFNKNAAVELYYNGGKKFETTSSGATVTGSLGIGTTSPAGELHISSGTSGDCKLIIEADTDNNNENDNPLIVFRQDGGLEESAIGMGFTSTASDNILTLANSVTNGGISFATGTTIGYTNAVERVRIDTAGNVGIGSTSPTAKLEINEGTDKIVQFTGGIGQIGNVAGVFAVNDAKSEIADFGIMGNTLKFASGTAASGAERMRIDSSGNVFIGKTSSDVNVTGVELKGNGNNIFTRNNGIVTTFNRGTNNGQLISLQRSGFEGGTINITPTSASFNSGSSDRSVKKNFEDWTENTLDLFKKLNPQKFNYIIEDDGAEKNKGYIAQDLVDSFPEAYPKNDNNKYMFNPSGMVVYLMKAVQELTAKVEALEAK